MPGGDRTGPLGMGPMTGRAAGYCAGYGVPGYANPIGGRAFGLGFLGGFGGRGWRHWYYATGLPGWARAGYRLAWGVAPSTLWPTPEQEADALKSQAESLRTILETIQKRLETLEAERAK